MGFEYIYNTVAAETGLTNTNQRGYLTTKINEAAREIYRRKDLPIILQECFVRVTRNNEVSLPPFIGEVRAIRPGSRDYCTLRWELHTMYPRYNKQEWVHMWKNWRMKGKRAYALEFNNVAPGTIEIHEADTDCIVTIVGENENSNNVSESITLSEASVAWTKEFDTIKRIYKNKRTEYNIIIKDADGNEISMIYADQTDANYQIVDVSEYPLSLCCDAQCDDGTYIMEVLYKPILPEMKEFSDSFPVPDYDDVIVAKTLALLLEKEEGKEDRALLTHNKANQLVRDIVEDKTGNVVRKLTYKANPYFRNE